MEEQEVVTDVEGKVPRPASEVVFSRIDEGAVLLSTEEEGIEGGAVRIGVRRDGTEEFAAHACVELDGAPLLESPDLLEAYTPLPELDVFPERRASHGR